MAERAEIILSGRDQTAAAFATAQKNLAAFRAQAGAVAGSLGRAFAGVGAIGIAGSALNQALNPASVIRYADELGKLSQRTGVGVEALSALVYQGKLADVSTDELSAGLKRLNQNIAAAARGEKEQAEAFKAIGVSVVGLDGQVRKADEVLADIAERFATYGDGPNKVAIANAVGGKSFEKLIPLLNEGRKGISDARAELEKFGGVIGSDLADKAQKFNDNLTRMGVATNALKVSIAGGLVGDLADLSERFVNAARNGNLLELTLTTLNTLLDPAALGVKGSAILKDLLPEEPLKVAQRNLEGLNDQVRDLQGQLANSPGSASILNELVRVEDRARKAAQEVAALRAQASGGLDNTETARRFNTPKTDAPALKSSTATGDASALLAKQLEGRLKAIRDAADNEADLFAFQNTRLQSQYADGELSIRDFYDGKARIQQQALAAQQEAFDQEVATLREFQRKATKPAERQERETQIADVLTRQSKAYREAGQAAEEAERQRTRAAEDFRRSLLEVDAQIAELSGDRFGAELIRNAERLAQAQRLLARDPGAEQGRLAALQKALTVQAEFARLQDDIARATERAGIAEEQFLIIAERQGLSRGEREQEVQRIRERSIAQLDEQIRQAEALATTTKDPSVLLYLDQLRLARERAFDARDPGLLRFNELARDSGRTLADGFASAVLEGDKLSDVISRLDKQLTALVFEDLITQPLADSITGFIKGLGAGGSGGGAQTLISGVAAQLGGLLGGGGPVEGATGDFARGDRAFGAAADVAAQAQAAAASSATTAALSALSAAATTGATTTGAATAATAAFTAALSAATAAATGQAAGGAVSSLADGELLSLFFHGGGVVGAGGTQRPVPASAFEGALRYHTGGVVGDVPAILKRGEEVLTEADPRHRANGGGAGGRTINVAVNVQAAPNMTRQTAMQQGRQVGEAVQLALARNG